MKTEIHIGAENEEETEFLEMLAEARQYGLETADIDEEVMATIFSQFAAGLFSEASPESSNAPEIECPQCGLEVEDSDALGLGMGIVLYPCGCTVDPEEIPQQLYIEDTD